MDLDDKLFDIDVWNVPRYVPIAVKVKDIIKHEQQTPELHAMICDCLTKKVGQSARQTVRRILTREGTKFRHFDEWFRCVLDIQRTWYDNATDLCNQGFFPRLSYSFSKSPEDKHKDNPGGGGAKRKGNPSKYTGRESSPKGTNPKEDKPSQPTKIKEEDPPGACYGCGRTNHTSDQCTLLDHLNPHPDANTSRDTPWALSEKGKAWKLRGLDVCPIKDTLSGETHRPTKREYLALNKEQREERKAKSAAKKGPKKGDHEGRKSEYDLTTLSTSITHDDTVHCIIPLPNTNIQSHMLIDSGALDGNYVSEHLAAQLKAAGLTIRT